MKDMIETLLVVTAVLTGTAIACGLVMLATMLPG
jgi:hypothetical protein